MILLVTELERAQGEPEAQRVGHRARSEARQGPRPGGHGPRAGRHAARRRHRSSPARSSARCARSSTTAAGQLKTAGPSTPVEVLGLGGLPQPGDAFQALADAAKARQIALFRQTQAKEKALGGKGGRLTLESLQAADRRRRHEGAADHHQGRRAGLGRSARRHADQADATTRSRSASSTPASARSTSPTCCWRRRRTRSSSASTCGPTATPRTSPSARRSTSACTRSSTTSPTR